MLFQKFVDQQYNWQFINDKFGAKELWKYIVCYSQYFINAQLQKDKYGDIFDNFKNRMKAIKKKIDGMVKQKISEIEDEKERDIQTEIYTLRRETIKKEKRKLMQEKRKKKTN